MWRVLLAGLYLTSTSSASAQTIVSGIIGIKPEPKYAGANCPEGQFTFEVTKDLVLILRNNITEVARTTIAQDGTFSFETHAWHGKGNANGPTFEMWTMRRAYDCKYVAGFYNVKRH